jgi:hypothetical protein
MNNNRSTVNTTETIGRERTETLDEGIARMRTVFAGARRMDIRLGGIDGADARGNTVEGGVNGIMFMLRRGVLIPDVPEPIIEVLVNAGMDFVRESGWKDASGAAL